MWKNLESLPAHVLLNCFFDKMYLNKNNSKKTYIIDCNRIWPIKTKNNKVDNGDNIYNNGFKM